MNMQHTASSAIRLSPGMRLQWERTQDQHVLLYPEGMVQLNESAAMILGLCDGSRTAQSIIDELRQRFAHDPADPSDTLAADILEFIAAARSRGWLVDG